MDTQTLVFGAYYGALGVMALYNFSMFFRLKENSYLTFSGFISWSLPAMLVRICASCADR